MSANTEKAVDILCRNCGSCTGEDYADCGEVEELRRAIAEAQLDAVEKVLFLSPRKLAVYITKLRKAAGRGELWQRKK